MKIKNHQNKNEYCLANGFWVRNFAKQLVQEVDINNLVPIADMQLILANEVENHNRMLQQIDTEKFNHPKIAIVSDGYKFDEKHKLLENLKDVIVIGTNGSLDKWNVPAPMHYYVVNNPFPECLNFLPKNQRAWPRCIASKRTNYNFINKFKGLIYEYSPVSDAYYSGLKSDADYFIDDYRNPICAAIGLAYRFGVNKLLILCCDEVYDKERPGCDKLENGFWVYPPQRVAHGLIDANLFWLSRQGVKIGSHSQGLDYKHASYIEEGNIVNFFES